METVPQSDAGDNFQTGNRWTPAKLAALAAGKPRYWTPRRLASLQVAGNRCGFDLQRPRLSITVTPHRHTFIARAQERAVTFYADRDDVRGERAEAVVLVVQAMLARCSIVNLRVVDHETGKGISRRKLARAAGLSISRVKGALHYLDAAGYLGGFQPRDHNGDGLPTVRWFTKAFFVALGLLREANGNRAARGVAPIRAEAFTESIVGRALVRRRRIELAARTRATWRPPAS
jgi:hypothetical protein